jgi:hypothetical protein
MAVDILRITSFLRTKVEGKDLSLGTGDRSESLAKGCGSRPETRTLHSMLEATDLGLFQQSADPDQNHRPDERDDDRSN